MGPDSATGLVVGTGDFVYDVFRPWGLLPAGWTFGTISHVAVDSKDRVSFYQRKAQTNYYGVPISRGLDEPDLQGTCLLTWAAAMIWHLVDPEKARWVVLKP